MITHGSVTTSRCSKHLQISLSELLLGRALGRLVLAFLGRLASHRFGVRRQLLHHLRALHEHAASLVDIESHAHIVGTFGDQRGGHLWCLGYEKSAGGERLSVSNDSDV